MNAVATPTVKPEITTSATPVAVQRDGRTRGDGSPAAPSFMSAMQAVGRDKPQERFQEGNAEAPPTIAMEDASGPSVPRDGALDANTFDAHGVMPVEGDAVVLPGDGINALVEPAMARRITTGAAEASTAPAAAVSGDASSLKAMPLASDMRGAVRPRLSLGMTDAAPQPPAHKAVAAVHPAPQAPNAHQAPGTGADVTPAAMTTAAPAEAPSPGTGDIVGASRARIPASEGSSAHRINANAAEGATRNSSPSRPQPSSPMPEGGEALYRQPQAVTGQTASPVNRLFEDAGRQASLTTSAPVPNPEMAVGRESGKATIPTPEVTPSARPAGESAATHDDASPNGDGKRSEAHPRPWLAADQNLDAKSTERPLRLDLDSRSEGMTPIDRPGAPPAGKNAPPLMVEKAPTPTAEAFRSQNLGSIVERLAVSVRGSQSEARIALKPDHLGSIRLQIATENNTVNIRIMTEFPMARDLLESHLPQLKTDLQHQGLELDEFNITLNDEDQHFRREARRQPGTLRAPLGDGRRKALSEAAPDELTENHPTDRRPAATGIDFFA